MSRGTGPLLGHWSYILHPGVQGEDKGAAMSEGKVEGLILVCQNLSEGQTLGDQREVFFRHLFCFYFSLYENEIL